MQFAGKIAVVNKDGGVIPTASSRSHKSGPGVAKGAQRQAPSSGRQFESYDQQRQNLSDLRSGVAASAVDNDDGIHNVVQSNSRPGTSRTEDSDVGLVYAPKVYPSSIQPKSGPLPQRPQMPLAASGDDAVSSASSPAHLRSIPSNGPAAISPGHNSPFANKLLSKGFAAGTGVGNAARASANAGGAVTIHGSAAAQLGLRPTAMSGFSALASSSVVSSGHRPGQGLASALAAASGLRPASTASRSVSPMITPVKQHLDHDGSEESGAANDHDDRVAGNQHQPHVYGFPSHHGPYHQRSPAPMSTSPAAQQQQQQSILSPAQQAALDDLADSNRQRDWSRRNSHDRRLSKSSNSGLAGINDSPNSGTGAAGDSHGSRSWLDVHGGASHMHTGNITPRGEQQSVHRGGGVSSVSGSVGGGVRTGSGLGMSAGSSSNRASNRLSSAGLSAIGTGSAACSSALPEGASDQQQQQQHPSHSKNAAGATHTGVRDDRNGINAIGDAPPNSASSNVYSATNGLGNNTLEQGHDKQQHKRQPSYEDLIDSDGEVEPEIDALPGNDAAAPSSGEGEQRQYLHKQQRRNPNSSGNSSSKTGSGSGQQGRDSLGQRGKAAGSAPPSASNDNSPAIEAGTSGGAIRHGRRQVPQQPFLSQSPASNGNSSDSPAIAAGADRNASSSHRPPIPRRELQQRLVKQQPVPSAEDQQPRAHDNADDDDEEEEEAYEPSAAALSSSTALGGRQTQHSASGVGKLPAPKRRAGAGQLAAIRAAGGGGTMLPAGVQVSKAGVVPLQQQQAQVSVPKGAARQMGVDPARGHVDDGPTSASSSSSSISPTKSHISSNRYSSAGVQQPQSASSLLVPVPGSAVSASVLAARSASQRQPDHRSSYLNVDVGGPRVAEQLNEALVQSENDKLVYSRKARSVNYTPHTLNDYRQAREALGMGQASASSAAGGDAGSASSPALGGYGYAAAHGVSSASGTGGGGGSHAGIRNRKSTGVPGYYELGRLGPDLSSSEVQAAQAARDRQKAYASQVAAITKDRLAAAAAARAMRAEVAQQEYDMRQQQQQLAVNPSEGALMHHATGHHQQTHALQPLDGDYNIGFATEGEFGPDPHGYQGYQVPVDTFGGGGGNAVSASGGPVSGPQSGSQPMLFSPGFGATGAGGRRNSYAQSQPSHYVVQQSPAVIPHSLSPAEAFTRNAPGAASIPTQQLQQQQMPAASTSMRVGGKAASSSSAAAFGAGAPTTTSNRQLSLSALGLERRDPAVETRQRAAEARQKAKEYAKGVPVPAVTTATATTTTITSNVASSSHVLSPQQQAHLIQKAQRRPSIVPDELRTTGASASPPASRPIPGMHPSKKVDRSSSSTGAGKMAAKAMGHWGYGGVGDGGYNSGFGAGGEGGYGTDGESVGSAGPVDQLALLESQHDKLRADVDAIRRELSTL